MMKAILLAGAMAFAAPAVGQVNANDGTMGQTKPGTPQEKAKKSAKPTTTQQVTTSTEDSLTGTEGTTHSHSISSSTDGTATDPQGNPETEPTTVRQTGAAKVEMQESTKAATAAATPPTETADTSTAATTATATTVSTGPAAAPAYTGIGGPAGNLREVAGEVLGDSSRVDRVMRGGDPSMKASDLLNAAMLTLIQSGTPR